MASAALKTKRRIFVAVDVGETEPPFDGQTMEEFNVQLSISGTFRAP